MRFNENDRDYLRYCGEDDIGINQIERASRSKILVLKLDKGDGSKEERISQRKAIEILGIREFFSGLQRAAFHGSCSRESEDGKYSIYFDCYKLFKEEW